MFGRRIIIFALLAIACAKANAQYDVPFSHYWVMEPYFNPASVGKEPKLNIAGAYALNFAGKIYMSRGIHQIKDYVAITY